MFTVVYQFKVKNGLEKDFERYWHEGTKLIRKERKSLGSRLHRAADGSYVAYAQWPSRDAWKNFPPSSPELKDTLQKMNSCLAQSDVTFELQVIDDLLGR